MPVFKDEIRKTYYVKLYYTDWTGQRRQKLKRGFEKSREAKTIFIYAPHSPVLQG